MITSLSLVSAARDSPAASWRKLFSTRVIINSVLYSARYTYYVIREPRSVAPVKAQSSPFHSSSHLKNGIPVLLVRISGFAACGLRRLTLNDGHARVDYSFDTSSSLRIRYSKSFRDKEWLYCNYWLWNNRRINPSMSL